MWDQWIEGKAQLPPEFVGVGRLLWADGYRDNGDFRDWIAMPAFYDSFYARHPHAPPLTRTEFGMAVKLALPATDKAHGRIKVGGKWKTCRAVSGITGPGCKRKEL